MMPLDIDREDASKTRTSVRVFAERVPGQFGNRLERSFETRFAEIEFMPFLATFSTDQESQIRVGSRNVVSTEMADQAFLFRSDRFTSNRRCSRALLRAQSASDDLGGYMRFSEQLRKLKITSRTSTHVFLVCLPEAQTTRETIRPKGSPRHAHAAPASLRNRGVSRPRARRGDGSWGDLLVSHILGNVINQELSHFDVMPKYTKWFKSSWNRLQSDYRKGTFDPQSENDITAHLYHHLFMSAPKERPRPFLVTERPVRIGGRKRERRLDLAVVRRKSRGLRYIVEIKDDKHPRPSASRIMKRVKNDLEKLAKTRSVENSVRRSPVMVYFCRKLEGRYIDKELEKNLKTEIRKFNEDRKKEEKVLILYGPLRQ